MIMNKLLAGTALALVLGATPLLAQSQPQDGKSGSAPGAQPGGGAAQKGGDADSAQGAKEKAAPKATPDGAKGSAQKDTSPSDKGGKAAQKDQSPAKGSAGTADKDKSSGKSVSGTADKDGKSAAQKDSDSKAGDKQGTAQKDTSGAPKKADAPADKTTPKAADKAAGQGDADRKAADDKSGEKAGRGERVQLTEEKRTRVRDVFTRQNVERETNININVSIGTRVPRSLRLYPIPVAVIEIVPEYRSYRYVVIRDEICIIDPDTYEIVTVLDRSSTTAGRGSGSSGSTGAAVTLTLSDEQRTTILRNVDIRNSKRLGIGSVSVGVDVPRSAELVEFPSVVVERVPEVREYRYFVHEDDIAVVNPRDSKVVLVIEGKR